MNFIRSLSSKSSGSTGGEDSTKQHELERALVPSEDMDEIDVGEGSNDPDGGGVDGMAAMDPAAGEVGPSTKRSDPDPVRRRRRAGRLSVHATEEISPAVYKFAACAAWNSAILGYDFGVNSLSVMLVQKSLNLTDLQVAGYMGALEGFACLGAATTSFINDRFGRRGCFVMTSFGFLLGDLLQASAQSYAQLMVGRSILGVSIGWGLAIDPMYISEISPSKRRGFLVSWSEIAINVGVVFGFASGIVFYHTPDDYAWRYMYGTGAVFPLTMLLLVRFYMPESPRWLLQKKRDDDAKEVLTTLCSGNEGEAELIFLDIHESIAKEEEAFHPGWKFLLCNPTPAYRRMLLAGIVAGISQQVVGIAAIGNAQTFVLYQAGVHDRLYQALTLVGIQIMKSLVTLLSSHYIDSWGRRRLSFISIAGIFVSLGVLALDFHLSSGATSVVAVVGLLGYMVSFAAGMGPVAWLVPSEVFTTSIRAKGISITTFCNRTVSTIMGFSFIPLKNAVSWSGMFLVLMFLSVVMAALIHVFLPETTGRSLEDMAIYFASLTGDRSVLDHLEGESLSVDSSSSNETKRTSSTTMTSAANLI
ncbi:hypothetical protein ACHAWF_014417 [Thalassiosira exigua]